MSGVVLRDRSELPRLGHVAPDGPLVLDTNVFINAIAGRGPSVLRQMLRALSQMFVAAPTRAELSWVSGRLDPGHPNTARVLAAYERLSSEIDVAKVLVPEDRDWVEGGKLAGLGARVLAGGGGRIATAFDRVELISDAIVAILARSADFTVVTEDAHFDVFAQLLPGLKVVFYDRP